MFRPLAVLQPNAVMMTSLSLIPFFTPMLMLMRQTAPGGIPAWQPWVGLVGIALAAAAISWMAARIFRLTILLQGQTPRPANLIRWGFRG